MSRRNFGRTEARLYNPGPAHEQTYGNKEIFKFPARDEKWTDPVTKEEYPEPGVLPIRPRGFQIDHDFRSIDNLSRLHPEVRVYHTPEEVVDYFVGEDGISGTVARFRGVRLLSLNHSKAEDDRIKAEAQEAFYLASRDHFEQIIARHRKQNAELVAAGRSKVPPSKPVLDAMRALQTYEAGPAQPKHECPDCGLRTMELKGANGLEGHITEYHPAEAAELLKTAGIKKAPGRPRKAVVAA
jgi:hypothetical protein